MWPGRHACKQGCDTVGTPMGHIRFTGRGSTARGGLLISTPNYQYAHTYVQHYLYFGIARAIDLYPVVWKTLDCASPSTSDLDLAQQSVDLC